MERNLNALLVLVLSTILLSALAIGMFTNAAPCPLCLLQRMGMIGVAIGAVLNIRFGIHRSYYALSLLSIIFGGAVALRHMALHVCPQFPKFGEPIWGLSFYTWSFLIFVCSLCYIASLLLLCPQKEQEKEIALSWLHKMAFLFLFVVCIANVIETLFVCGLSACVPPGSCTEICRINSSGFR